MPSSVLVPDAPTPLFRRRLAGERCDRCCAAAVVTVVVASGLDLVFCGHHAREHERRLRQSGALLRVDGRSPSLYS